MLFVIVKNWVLKILLVVIKVSVIVNIGNVNIMINVVMNVVILNIGICINFIVGVLYFRIVIKKLILVINDLILDIWIVIK